MNKADVTAVTTLAAHLATKRALTFAFSPDLESGLTHISTANECAADAMKLQRLGARAMRNADKLADLKIGKTHILPGGKLFTEEYAEIECGRIHGLAQAILKPYGLRCDVRDEPFKAECLFILGLPGNTGGGEGFSI